MAAATKDIAWVAGILEGEGSFSIKQTKSTTKYLTPRISVEMNDRDIVSRVRNLINPHSTLGTRHRGMFNKRTYTFNIYGITAIEWMMTIYCLMGTRRKARIKEIIDVWKLTKYQRYRTGRRNPGMVNASRDAEIYLSKSIA